MSSRIQVLLSRSAFVRKLIEEEQSRHTASWLRLMRLKKLNLAIERHLHAGLSAMLGSPPAARTVPIAVSARGHVSREMRRRFQAAV